MRGLLQLALANEPPGEARGVGAEAPKLPRSVGFPGFQVGLCCQAHGRPPSTIYSKKDTVCGPGRQEPVAVAAFPRWEGLTKGARHGRVHRKAIGRPARVAERIGAAVGRLVGRAAAELADHVPAGQPRIVEVLDAVADLVVVLLLAAVRGSAVAGAPALVAGRLGAGALAAARLEAPAARRAAGLGRAGLVGAAAWMPVDVMATSSRATLLSATRSPASNVGTSRPSVRPGSWELGSKWSFAVRLAGQPDGLSHECNLLRSIVNGRSGRPLKVPVHARRRRAAASAGPPPPRAADRSKRPSATPAEPSTLSTSTTGRPNGRAIAEWVKKTADLSCSARGQSIDPESGRAVRKECREDVPRDRNTPSGD